jgi:hypothetical protein
MPRPKSPNNPSKKNDGVQKPESTANAAATSTLGTMPEEAAAASSAAMDARTTDTKTVIARKPRKPEIVKTDSRANLVPINLEDEIRQLAYLFSERRGFVPGHETEDWLAAEHEVLERYHQQSA